MLILFIFVASLLLVLLLLLAFVRLWLLLLLLLLVVLRLISIIPYYQGADLCADRHDRRRLPLRAPAAKKHNSRI